LLLGSPCPLIFCHKCVGIPNPLVSVLGYRRYSIIMVLGFRFASPFTCIIPFRPSPGHSAALYSPSEIASTRYSRNGLTLFGRKEGLPRTIMSDKNTVDASDSFQLYDLRVEVVCPEGTRIMCGAKAGDHFTLQGEMLYLPPGQGISIYSLCQSPFLPPSKRVTINLGNGIAAVLPLLPAKQRVTDPNDWMSSDAEVACPDPHCKSRLRISRTGIRTFSHAETTVVPLKKPDQIESSNG
jgi:hypothetical protein